ncbi:hypothetical protein ACFVU2_09290 [Leifsonia sp. NPDC058194]|uniref:hypothetical protein n=1 Tax=Leifsonia sp. NPDC058194 TaxID=3346374 RepID=UPI0036DD6300
MSDEQSRTTPDGSGGADGSDSANGPEEPDAPYEDYENGTREADEARAEEAGLTSFGGPAFGTLYEPVDDGGFDAERNP